MATAEQIKTLLKSHFDNNSERFNTIALQIAANEARVGHNSLANEIKELVDKNKYTPVRILEFFPDLHDLVISASPKTHIHELIVPKSFHDRINRILREYKQKEKIKKFGLTNRRKILLAGSPGTGKTMTASVIAGELSLPLYTVLMDKLITKFMGETSAKLRQIFDFIKKHRGVYLFDEFDAIGTERAKDNDVGEMRRVLNAFLQFIEHDDSESFIIAATNNLNLLDQALFRRFDDVIHYNKPDEILIEKLIKNRLGSFHGKFNTSVIISHAMGLSHAEITQACDDSIKETILLDKKAVTKDLLIQMLEDRHLAYGGK
jgi:SpoVK/Ycf46/Vps4 family AAA+-type ATPase